MEDSKKKPVMIGIIVVCLGVAALVTYIRKSGGGGGIDSLSDDELKWVKCNNPACNAEYQLGMKTYFKQLEENMNPNPMATGPTALTCSKCGKRSVYGAYKCANPDCGHVFIEGISGQEDHSDRCPKCGQSETEESRKRRLGTN